MLIYIYLVLNFFLKQYSESMARRCLLCSSCFISCYHLIILFWMQLLHHNIYFCIAKNAASNGVAFCTYIHVQCISIIDFFSSTARSSASRKICFPFIIHRSLRAAVVFWGHAAAAAAAAGVLVHLR